MEKCAEAGAFVPAAAYTQNYARDPLAGKVVHLTTAFLNSKDDQKAGFVRMARELCSEGKVSRIIEGDLPASFDTFDSNVSVAACSAIRFPNVGGHASVSLMLRSRQTIGKVDFTIVPTSDSSAGQGSRLSFRSFVKIIDNTQT